MEKEIKEFKNRATPGNITSLNPNEIFVFGSNESGRHGKGAAKTALKWGAKWGTPEGFSGKTYAIPTKDSSIRNTLSIKRIGKYVDNFIAYAKATPSLIFLVTEIGCGLAGYEPKDIAPLFKDSIDVDNIFLPDRFWKELLK